MTAELVPAAKPEIVRNDKGQFIKGHAGGTRRGSQNTLTKEMRRAALEVIANGGDAGNPLLILYGIARLEDAPLRVKLEAADRLAKHIWGVKNALEIEMPDPADEERIAKTRSLFAALFVEKVAHDQQQS